MAKPNCYFIALLVFSIFICSTSAGTKAVHESHKNIRQKRINPEEYVNQPDAVTASQHFLPSFGPLFGHSFGHHRAPRVYQEAEYLPEVPTYHLTASASNRESSMLGSGNFGVIPGGTYYSGGAGESAALSEQYLYDGNSHGRPHRFSGNPRPSPYRDPEDFFAGFRDFADITAPTKSSFSQYHMVYAPADDYYPADDKTKSKKKRKLNKYQENEKDKTIKAKRKIHAGEKELYEPMVALSR
ncbi:uncharacterized protein LOC126841877 [Adelges cooleyi]|uniref:uncharacterized protein LOC126841877 n=1 Tax=Adelges cooleyi TaxID=133065 RepID=UPI0021806108|nr:uncharacterized protein LOC126841877 [Adelges cooleyi]